MWADNLPKDACFEAREWCKTQPSLVVAWKTCTRGDWMLWLLGELNNSTPWSEDRVPLLRAAIECAEQALPYATNDTITATLWCLDALHRWCNGEDNQNEVIAAQDATDDAAADAATYAVAATHVAAIHVAAYDAAAYAAAAADAAAYVAYAAAAAYVAYAAANADAAIDAAAYVAYAAAAAAYAADARKKSLAKSADIVRKHFLAPPTLVKGDNNV